MASTRALEAVASAVAALLDEGAAQPAPYGFPGAVDVGVISSSGIGDIGEGAGVLPYRIEVNPTYRHPHGRVAPGGGRQLDRLPVDLRLLVIVAAGETTTKLGLAGWIMRKLEDHPVVPLGLLNRDGDVFGLDEPVEIGVDEVPHEELLHLWEVFGQPRYDAISLPYLARNISIESQLDLDTHREVQERLHRFGSLAGVGP